jgi:hypothetical protein
MTSDIETINGHQYTITRDDQGNTVSQVGCDPAPALFIPPIRTAALALIAQLKAGSATAQQQQQALALILGLLLNLSSV